MASKRLLSAKYQIKRILRVRLNEKFNFDYSPSLLKKPACEVSDRGGVDAPFLDEILQQSWYALKRSGLHATKLIFKRV
jgi:hypothetical protein